MAPSTAANQPQQAEWQQVLGELDRMGRSHLLAWCLACGALLLLHSWRGAALAHASVPLHAKVAAVDLDDQGSLLLQRAAVQQALAAPDDK